jgi:hypothetical protein
MTKRWKTPSIDEPLIFASMYFQALDSLPTVAAWMGSPRRASSSFSSKYA